MVESSIGVSAPLIIGEESVIDPVVGVITGIAYGGMKIYDKIRHKSKDDYSIDVLVDEEQKQPVDTTLENWRNIRSRDAGHSQWSHQQPTQIDEEEPIPNENFGWEDVVPIAQDPAIVIQNNEQVDHLNQVVVDVQIPLDQPVEQQPQQTSDEMLLFPRDYRPEDQNPNPNNGDDPNNNDGDPNGNDPDPNGNDPDPNDGNNNDQQEEQKDGRRIQDNPLFNNAINQIVNQISNLEKKKDDVKESDNDKERERYLADIEFQIRSQQSLIDLLTKFSAGQLDAKAVNIELDQIEQLLEQQKKDSFAEDFVFSDVIEMF